MVEHRIIRGLVGTAASIVASVYIFIVLYAVYRSGPEAAFTRPCVYLLWGLVGIGVVAYYGYLGYARKAYWRMKYVSPVALFLGAASIIAGQWFGPSVGGGLIFLAYIVETSVGLRLAVDYQEESRLGSLLFLIGVSMFVVSLPLILVDRRFALLGLAGDVVKIVGLLAVLYFLLRRT